VPREALATAPSVRLLVPIPASVIAEKSLAAVESEAVSGSFKPSGMRVVFLNLRRSTRLETLEPGSWKTSALSTFTELPCQMARPSGPKMARPSGPRLVTLAVLVAGSTSIRAVTPASREKSGARGVVPPMREPLPPPQPANARPKPRQLNHATFRMV